MSKDDANGKESRNWYKDRYQAVLLQRRLLMGLAFLSMASTLVVMIILSQMVPMKGIEPFLIQVDPKSGITQMVNPMSTKEITALESVNDFFIVQYIRSRESYDVRTFKQNYGIVRIMSEQTKVFRDFKRQSNPNDPMSVPARMGSTGTRSVKFKSIVYRQQNQAQARLLIEETTASGSVLQSHKIATIVFEYAKLELTAEERYINPLGFRVLEYRIDEDAAPR